MEIKILKKITGAAVSVLLTVPKPFPMSLQQKPRKLQRRLQRKNLLKIMVYFLPLSSTTYSRWRRTQITWK